MPEFAGKVALITGAAHGIGRAAARHFAAEGAQVVIADIQEQEGRAAAQAIGAAGGEACYIHADVGRRHDIERLITQSVAHFGRLDILVNNAYWSKRGTVEELCEEDWDRGLAVMLKAVFLLGKVAIPHLRAAGGGAIVNLASVHAYGAHPRYPVYAAAKAAIVNLTRQMAVDYGPDNIRVNAVSPGWVITRPQLWDAETIRRGTAIYPLRRAGTPEEIAEVIAFLASPRASFVTGHTVVADGGLTAQLQDAVIFDRILK
jgi:NAD(P)-dependent dehydrogenase (short-subunit alcohol dehydrogenase family)